VQVSSLSERDFSNLDELAAQCARALRNLSINGAYLCGVTISTLIVLYSGEQEKNCGAWRRRSPTVPDEC
jgi:hypothetical protein